MNKHQFEQRFRTYAWEGDTIDVEINGITYRATIVRDDDSSAPDERQDGFWPSLNPSSDGYIGPKSRRTLGRAMDQAKEVMRAWRNDEWFYCGVVVSAHLDTDEWNHETNSTEVVLSSHCASLFGLECNYPAFRKREIVNSYLTTCADELLAEAVPIGEQAARDLLATLQQRGAA